jgi:PTH1 family peptidyl-tRNA hydrolase
VDDLSLPLEVMRLRKAGTHAGHNGLRDIQDVLGTDAYPKLRFGIGNQFPKGRQVEFVLGKWKSEEVPLVNLKIEKAAGIIEQWVQMGIERAMSNTNQLKYQLPG